MTLHQKIGGVLFYKASPVSKKSLLSMFSVDTAQLDEALQNLSQQLAGSGITLIHTDTQVQIVTDPSLDELIMEVRKDDMKRDIGKAGAETLSIILYRGPILRSDIDRIRGVNSSFILRNLLVRGLIERTQNGNTYSFDVTPALLAHLGIQHKTQLPGYAETLDKLEQFEKQQSEETP